MLTFAISKFANAVHRSAACAIQGAINSVALDNIHFRIMPASTLSLHVVRERAPK